MDLFPFFRQENREFLVLSHHTIRSVPWPYPKDSSLSLWPGSAFCWFRKTDIPHKLYVIVGGYNVIETKDRARRTPMTHLNILRFRDHRELY